MSIPKTRPGDSFAFAPGAPALTLPEIPPDCISLCTWVPGKYRPDGKTGLRLKYKSGACPDRAFHRRLELAAASGEPSP